MDGLNISFCQTTVVTFEGKTPRWGQAAVGLTFPGGPPPGCQGGWGMKSIPEALEQQSKGSDT